MIVDEYEPYVPAQRVIKLRNGLLMNMIKNQKKGLSELTSRNWKLSIRHPRTGAMKIHEIFEPDEYQ